MVVDGPWRRLVHIPPESEKRWECHRGPAWTDGQARPGDRGTDFPSPPIRLNKQTGLKLNRGEHAVPSSTPSSSTWREQFITKGLHRVKLVHIVCTSYIDGRLGTRQIWTRWNVKPSSPFVIRRTCPLGPGRSGAREIRVKAWHRSITTGILAFGC